MATVLGVLSSPDATADALHGLRDAGFEDLDAFSPVLVPPKHAVLVKHLRTF